jgi:uncharacterized protein (DUF2267 family)
VLVRGLYYEGWSLEGKPHEGPKQAFLAHIRAEFQEEPQVYPEAVTWALFQIPRRYLSLVENGDVQQELPAADRSGPKRGQPTRAEASVFH